MTANFNVAFAMSGTVFWLMLFLWDSGVTRQTFCLSFCAVIAVFNVIAWMFY